MPQCQIITKVEDGNREVEDSKIDIKPYWEKKVSLEEKNKFSSPKYDRKKIPLKNLLV